jgi:hypothetical protein
MWNIWTDINTMYEYLKDGWVKHVDRMGEVKSRCRIFDA